MRYDPYLSIHPAHNSVAAGESYFEAILLFFFISADLVDVKVQHA